MATTKALWAREAHLWPSEAPRAAPHQNKERSLQDTPSHPHRFPTCAHTRGHTHTYIHTVLGPCDYRARLSRRREGRPWATGMGSGHSRAQRRSSLGHGQTVPARASNLNPAQVTALWSLSPPRSRLATGHCRLPWPGPRRRGPGEAGDLMSLRRGHRGSESISHSPRRSWGGQGTTARSPAAFPTTSATLLPTSKSQCSDLSVQDGLPESPRCPPPHRPSDKPTEVPGGQPRGLDGPTALPDTCADGHGPQPLFAIQHRVPTCLLRGHRGRGPGQAGPSRCLLPGQMVQCCAHSGSDSGSPRCPRQGLLEVGPAGETPSMAAPGGVFLWPVLA